MKDVSHSRRRLVMAGSAVGAISAMGFPAIVKAQSDKIRIGHLTPLTGFLGPLGEYGTMGIKQAIDEVNKAGGVMGRQLELITEDSVNPATAASKAQRMFERDGITCLLGEINSAAGLAISQVAARNQKSSSTLAVTPTSCVARVVISSCSIWNVLTRCMSTLVVVRSCSKAWSKVKSGTSSQPTTRLATT